MKLLGILLLIGIVVYLFRDMFWPKEKMLHSPKEAAKRSMEVRS